MKDCTVMDWTLTDGFTRTDSEGLYSDKLDTDRGFTRTDNEGLYSDGLDTDRWIHKDRQ